MGKKVNLFLLIMIMIVLLGFGGISVYYQYTFKNVNQNLNTISTERDMYKQDLSQTEEALTTALRNLNSTETDIRKYDVLYEQKAGELEEKQDELTDTRANLIRATLQKEVYKKQIDQAYAEILVLTTSINTLEGQVASLEDDVDDLTAKISCLTNTDDSDELSNCL